MPDDKLSKQGLIGQNIIKAGIQAITNESSMRFVKTYDTDLMREENRIFAVDNVDTLKPIDEKDVHCADLDEKNKQPLITLLNHFRHIVVFKLE